MKAWRVYGAGDLRFESLDSQPVGDECVKIKLLYTAISLTDSLIYGGKIPVSYPLIPGRQGLGMVTETGANVTTTKRGDIVAVSPFLNCGMCQACSAGKPSDCEKLLYFGKDEDGFLRDFAVIPASAALVLPDRVNLKDAIFLEHIATAVNTMIKLNLEKGEHLVIVGASVMGIALAQVAMYYQCVPILVDYRQDRLDIAAQLGVYYTVNTVDSDARKKIFSVTGGRMVEAAAYMLAGEMRFQQCFDYVAKGGRIAMVGWDMTIADVPANLATVVDKGLSIVGVNGPGKSMSSAINMLANKTVSVEKLASREIKLDEVGTYLDEIKENPGKYIKVIVNLDT